MMETPKLDDDMNMTIHSLMQKVDQLSRENEVLHYQRLTESHRCEFLVRELCSIHALLYPPRVTLGDGRVMQFQSPMEAQHIQALSDKIREIPDILMKRHQEAPCPR